MTYVITPLHVGTITRKKTNMVFECKNNEPTEFPLISFLLVREDGHKFLIDTGGSTPDGKRWMPYERPDSQNLDSKLAEHGVMPDEIEGVFFTHLHWDHAGSNALFKNAEFYVQKKEYESIAQKEMPGFERDLLLKNEYVLIDGDQTDVIPGVSVILTPGHSAGSQTIIVDTAEGKTAVAGDLIPTYDNIAQKLPSAVHYDYDTIMKSMDKVLALGFIILPGHEMSLVI